MKDKKKILSIALKAIALVAILGLPQIVGKSTLRIFNQAEIYIIYAMSTTVLMGYAGIMTLGQAAFFAVGAYAETLFCMNLGWSFIPSLIGSVIVTAIYGMILSLPLSRITGKYVAIVTLAYCEITNLILQNWDSLTRGTRGIMGIPRATIFGYQIKNVKENYYLILVLIVIIYILVRWLRNSKLGRNFLAIKADSIAAEAMGIKVFATKILAFTISAAIAGVGGALYPHYMSYISPASFTSALSVTVVSIVVIGGLGNINGAIIATLFMVIAPQYMRDFGNYRMVAYGVLLVLVMWLNHSIQGIRVKEKTVLFFKKIFKKDNMIGGETNE